MERLRLIAASLLAALMLHSASSYAAEGGGDANPVATHNLSASAAQSASQSAAVTQNMCVIYTYDQNGNRLSQTNATLNTQPLAWGATTYPCFVWGAN